MFSNADPSRPPFAKASLLDDSTTVSPGRDPRVVELVVGDLVDELADVLVSPAGDTAGHSSRVQLALRRKAGSELADAYDAALAVLPGRRLAPGENLVTPGYGLGCRHVVHCLPAAAPTDPAASVASIQHCLRGAFARCIELGATSVALPAVGTGSYGHRVSAVAEASIRAALQAQRLAIGPARIRFVLAGPATLETFLHALSAERALEARHGG